MALTRPGHWLNPGDKEVLIQGVETGLVEIRIDTIGLFGPFFFGTMVVPQYPWGIGFRTPQIAKTTDPQSPLCKIV